METRFDCPRCNHEKTVHCKVLKGDDRGVAMCTICEASYSCRVHMLDRAIDIYHAWMDSLNG